jgi:ligand-binding sensor domain-containing protein
VVASDSGLHKILFESRLIKTYDLKSLAIEGDYIITAMLLGPANLLTVGTDNGHLAVVDLDDDKIVIQSTLEEAPLGLITGFVFHENKLVISTDNGLYVTALDFSQIEKISSKGEGLSSTDVVSLYKDEGFVWVGTYNGLDILSSSRFDLVIPPKSRRGYK